MQISVNIDTANADHVAAALAFMNALGGHEQPSNIFTKRLAEQQTEELEVDKSAQEKAAKAARAAARKAKAEAEAAAAKEETEDDDDLLGDDEEEEEELTHAILRQLTEEKVKADKTTNAPKVKERLQKYGASNVTSIPKDKFRDYYEFLTKL